MKNRLLEVTSLGLHTWSSLSYCIDAFMIIVWNKCVKKALLVCVTLNIIKFRFDHSSYYFQHILVPSHMFSSGQKEILAFKTNYSFYNHECQIYSVLIQILLHCPVALKVTGLNSSYWWELFLIKSYLTFSVSFYISSPKFRSSVFLNWNPSQSDHNSLYHKAYIVHTYSNMDCCQQVDMSWICVLLQIL